METFSYYRRNKERAKYYETMPSLTDQSQADDTDINLIMKRAEAGQMVRGAAGEPQYGDFSEVPQDLKTAIEKARQVKEIRAKLPPALREIPIEELLTYSREELKAIVDPEPKPKIEEEKK